MSHSLFIINVPNDDYEQTNEAVSKVVEKQSTENQNGNLVITNNNGSINNVTNILADKVSLQHADSEISLAESLASKTQTSEIPDIKVEHDLEKNENKEISESTKKDDSNANEVNEDVDIIQNKEAPHYGKNVKKVLNKFSIENDTWKLSDDKQTWQILFTTVTSNVDALLNEFLSVNVGDTSYTSLNVLPIQVNFPGILHTDGADSVQVSSEFVQSIKSRLTVAQVINSVQSGSQFTFDYVMLIIMASLIALVGLLENSSVLLVASMLVSPLMGPILGGTFGLVMQYKPLWSMGVKNELIGLAICVVVGFVIGFVFIHIPGWKHVTQEMSSRGAPWSLLVGVFVALPSGAGVALSILGGNAGSLVGVAISASLLPPAVNAGLCWSYATYMSITDQKFGNGTTEYHAEEVAKIGALSLTLTLINILLIFIMGVIILKVKEIAPHTGTAVTRCFWKNDIKTTREYLKKKNYAKKNESLNDELLDQIMDEAGVKFHAQKTVKGEESKKLKVNLNEMKAKTTLVDSFLPKTYSDANTLENSMRYLRERLQDKHDIGSRFHVSRVYNLVDTAFPSNSRFVVSNIDEKDNITMKKKKNTLNQPHLAGDTKVRKSSQQSALNVPLISSQAHDVESNF